MRAVLGLAAIVAAIFVGSLAFRTLPQDRTLSAFGTPLAGRSRSQRHNSQLALNRLRGATIQPGATFSFNRRVGTFSQDQGYRRAQTEKGNGLRLELSDGKFSEPGSTRFRAEYCPITGRQGNARRG